MTNDFHVGNSVGHCIIDSDVNPESMSCDFYLDFFMDGGYGRGVVALSGSTDELGGYMQVTAVGGDLPNSKGGHALLKFDPA